jgi:hypothetical protein
VPFGDEGATDLIAVHPGKITVEYEHVVVGEGEVGEGVMSVEGDVDGHALLAQTRGDRVGQLNVILDQ